MTMFAGFLLGLASGLHCLGMCGPLMAVMPFRQTTSVFGMAADRFLYHVARVTMYALLGLVMGFGVDLFHVNHLERTVALLGGSVMIAFATMQLILHRSPLPNRLTSKFSRPVSHAMRALLKGNRSWLTIVALGALNALLPCGLLYAALAGSVGAAATYQGDMQGATYTTALESSAFSSALQGAFFMAAFGIGTLPTMVAASIGVRLLTPKASKHLRSWAPSIAILAGAIIIVRGMALGIPYLSPSEVVPTSAATGKVTRPPACCTH